MFTIKYRDQDGFERLSRGWDIRVKQDTGGHPEAVGWRDADGDYSAFVDWPTNVYVMNEAGSTVGKYVLCVPPKAGVE